MDKSNEFIFQNDIIRQMEANGWKLGKPDNYNRELVLGFIKETQDGQWKKFCKLYLNDTEQKFLSRVASQLNKVDPMWPIKTCIRLAL